MEKKDKGFALMSLVAIVAIVAIIMLVTMNSRTTIIQPEEGQALSIDNEAGEARYAGGGTQICCSMGSKIGLCKDPDACEAAGGQCEDGPSCAKMY